VVRKKESSDLSLMARRSMHEERELRVEGVGVEFAGCIAPFYRGGRPGGEVR
jgi:hypothetical protein